MRWPQFLPGSNRIVYVTCDPARHVCRGMAADYLSRDVVPLMETDSRVQYAPPRRTGEPGAYADIRIPRGSQRTCGYPGHLTSMPRTPTGS